MKNFLFIGLMLAAIPSLGDEVAACRIKIDDALKTCDSTGDKKVRAALETAREDASGRKTSTKAKDAAKTPENPDNVSRTRVYRGTSK